VEEAVDLEPPTIPHQLLAGLAAAQPLETPAHREQQAKDLLEVPAAAMLVVAAEAQVRQGVLPQKTMVGRAVVAFRQPLLALV
jgi:hypothetical protein